jgi:hypothetical protein
VIIVLATLVAVTARREAVALSEFCKIEFAVSVPPIVVFPVILAVPITCNFEVGEVVPMPRFPSELIRTRSAPFTVRDRYLPDAVVSCL